MHVGKEDLDTSQAAHLLNELVSSFKHHQRVDRDFILLLVSSSLPLQYTNDEDGNKVRCLDDLAPKMLTLLTSCLEHPI